MGKDEKLKSNNGEEKKYQTHVVVNVYDLTPANRYTYWFGFGIFHSGIEVHGMEYGFGAHDYPVSGVFEVEPKSCPGFIYRCSISLGHIDMHRMEFQTFIEGVASEYHGNTYHLITKNCNHFTDDVAYRLTGKRIPGWVNRLARAGSVCSCLLPESLQATTVKQLPEYHEYIDDGEESTSSEGYDEQTVIEDPNQEKILLLTPKRAEPRDAATYAQRAMEEHEALIAYTTMNKANDWFRISVANPEGTRCSGKCWFVGNLLKYEFDFSSIFLSLTSPLHVNLSFLNSTARSIRCMEVGRFACL